MAYGFYITQRGLEKITEASNNESKVVINQYLVGDGGDLEGERDPGISQLGNELYRKSLTDVDSFEISGTKIMIKTVLPDEVPAMTFNEAGYLDTDDELIIYGTFRPITKNASNPEAPQIIEHDNYIEFTANQIDHVTIQTGNETMDSIVERVGALETGVENLKTTKADRTDLEALKEKIQILETTLNKVFPKIKVRCANKYEGATITFSHKDGTITSTVEKGKCIVIVEKTGTWTVTNSIDNKKFTIDVSALNEYVLEFGPIIYGVRVTKEEPDPEKRVVYTDDAVNMTPIGLKGSFGRADLKDWGDTWIFDKFYPVMLKTNGDEAYKLDPNDLTKKIGGGDSDIFNKDYDGNAMVRINKFYSKYSSDDTYEYYQISNEPVSGFEPIGFIRDDGTEMDRFYRACFPSGYSYSSSGDATMRSIAGLYLQGYTSPVNSLIRAQRNGQDYKFESYSQSTMLNILYLILCKNENSQITIGTGRHIHDDNDNNYKTGVTTSVGPIGCDETSKAVTFMWMEDYWSSNDHYGRMLRGLLIYDGKTYVRMKGPYPLEDVSSYSEVTGCKTGGGYPKYSIASNKYGRLPASYGGSKETYQCDYFYNMTWDATTKDYVVFISGTNGIWGIKTTTTRTSGAATVSALTYEPPTNEQ